MLNQIKKNNKALEQKIKYYEELRSFLNKFKENVPEDLQTKNILRQKIRMVYANKHLCIPIRSEVQFKYLLI